MHFSTLLVSGASYTGLVVFGVALAGMFVVTLLGVALGMGHLVVRRREDEPGRHGTRWCSELPAALPARWR